MADMTDMTEEFNSTNNKELETVLVYYNTDYLVTQAEERIKLLDNRNYPIDKSSYFFESKLLSSVTANLNQSPGGRILTNSPSLAINLSAYYGVSVLSVRGNKYPPVEELPEKTERLNMYFASSVQNITQFQHILSNAVKGDSVIFIDENNSV